MLVLCASTVTALKFLVPFSLHGWSFTACINEFLSQVCMGVKFYLNDCLNHDILHTSCCISHHRRLVCIWDSLPDEVASAVFWFLLLPVLFCCFKMCLIDAIVYSQLMV